MCFELCLLVDLLLLLLCLPLLLKLLCGKLWGRRQGCDVLLVSSVFLFAAALVAEPGVARVCIVAAEPPAVPMGGLWPRRPRCRR